MESFLVTEVHPNATLSAGNGTSAIQLLQLHCLLMPKLSTVSGNN